MTTLEASEVGRVSADAIRDLAERAVAGTPVADYAHRDPMPWATIGDGGWDLVGVPESHDGGGASLRDLAEVAMVWGHTCVALPLIETMWAKRWSAAARESDGPVTVSVARVGARGSSGVAPFALGAGVRVARSIGQAADVLELSPEAAEDDIAPHLRAGILPWTTALEPAAVNELAILWASEAAGAAAQLVDLSVAYAKERQQFGKPIGSFQAIKHRLADMHSMAQYAETAAVWASHEPENAQRQTRYALDISIKVAESAIQVHGGMGFTWEMGLHYYMRTMLMRRRLVKGLWQ